MVDWAKGCRTPDLKLWWRMAIGRISSIFVEKIFRAKRNVQFSLMHVVLSRNQVVRVPKWLKAGNPFGIFPAQARERKGPASLSRDLRSKGMRRETLNLAGMEVPVRPPTPKSVNHPGSLTLR